MYVFYEAVFLHEGNDIFWRITCHAKLHDILYMLQIIIGLTQM